MQIDSDISESQGLSSSLQPQQGDSAQLQELPSSRNNEGFPLVGEKGMNIEYKLDQFWKKQINIFFCNRKKFNRGRQLKKWPIWTTVLQNLLRGGLKQNVNKINSSASLVLSKKNPAKPKAATLQKLSILGKPVKSCNLHLIILSYRQTITKPLRVFDLEILDLNGKMVFKTINFTNCLDLKTQVEVVCKLYSSSLVLILQKQTFLSRLVENSQELIEWLSSLHDLQTLSLQQTSLLNLFRQGKKNKSKEIEPSKTQNGIKRCLGKYLWLKREFQIGLQQVQEGQCFTQDDVLVASLAYNLLCCYVDSTKGEFQQQIKVHSSTILKLFKEANIKLNTLNHLIKDNKGHFPFNLDNAHLCWGCKTKRIYTYCPTCSDLEGYTLALCNECYLPFHRERARCIPNRDEQFNNSLMDKWENFDRHLSALTASGEKESIGLKKEEND